MSGTELSEIESLRQQVRQLQTQLADLQGISASMGDVGAHWKAVFYNAPDIVIVVDANRRMLYFNHVYPPYKLEDVQGRVLEEFTFPDHKHIVVESLERVLKHGERSEYEVQDNLTRSWFSVRAAPVHVGKEIVGAVIICTDISPRKRIEEELQQSKQWFSTIFNTSPTAMVISTREDGRVLEANDAFVSMTGRAREEIIGQTTATIGWWKNLGERALIVEQIRQTGYARGIVKSFLDVHGQERIGQLAMQQVKIGEQYYLITSAEDITEQHRADLALRDSETRLRLFLEQTPAILWRADDQLNFTSGIGAGLAGLGIKPGGMDGISYYKFFNTEDSKHPAIAAARKALGGQATSYDIQWAGHDYHVYVEPLRDCAGKVIGINGIAMEVTEQERTKRELLESEERFRQLAENMRDVVYLSEVDPPKLLYLNPAYERIWGRPRQEVYDNVYTWQKSLHPDDVPKVLDVTERLFAGAKQMVAEYRIVRSDGEVRWMEDRSFVFEMGPNAPRRIAGVVSDITHRKQQEGALRQSHDALEARVRERTAELASLNEKLFGDIARREIVEKQLRESEERFRVIAQTSPMAMVISNVADGTFLYANPAADDALGVRRGSLIGRLTTDFYYDDSERAPLVAEIVNTGTMRDFELRMKRQDGSPIWMSLSVQTLRYAEHDAVLTCALDITSRKNAEESLKREQRLLQRLLDLHDRDRQLIAYEVHDGIVQDMTGALMFVEAALPDIPTDHSGAHETLGQATRLLRGSINEARRLINDLRPTILEESGVIAAVENLAEEIQRASGVEIEFAHQVSFDRIAPALEMAIFRIVQESLNNAWRHSQTKRARVKLTQDQDSLLIEIRDWGIGFDTAKVVKKRYGLMGVKERARLLGGKHRIHSVLGQGTTVSVTLPIHDVLLPKDWASEVVE